MKRDAPISKRAERARVARVRAPRRDRQVLPACSYVCSCLSYVAAQRGARAPALAPLRCSCSSCSVCSAMLLRAVLAPGLPFFRCSCTSCSLSFQGLTFSNLTRFPFHDSQVSPFLPFWRVPKIYLQNQCFVSVLTHFLPFWPKFNFWVNKGSQKGVPRRVQKGVPRRVPKGVAQNGPKMDPKWTQNGPKKGTQKSLSF